MDHLKGLLNCLIYTYYTATIMLRVLKFLKRIYVSLIIKVKDFGSIFTKNSYFSISIDIEKYYINNIRIINSILYGILAILSYVFIHNTSITGFIVIFIFTIIFFSIFMYTSDNFKLSNNLFIKILQKFVFLIIKIALIVLFLNIFDISLFDKIFCDSDDEDNNEVVEDNKEDKNKEVSDKDVVHIKTDDKDEYYNFKVKKEVVDSVINSVSKVLSDNLPDLGVAAVAGKAATETIKQTVGMRPLPRAGAIAGATFAAAVGTKSGIVASEAINKNISMSNSIKASTSSINEEVVKTTEAPTDIDGGFIHSALEDSEIPLVIIVNSLNYFNYLELSLILSLFLLFFRKYLMEKLNRFILNNRNNKIESINDNNVTLNKVFNIKDKYVEYVFLYIFICLLWIKFMHLYAINNLAEDIDSYVMVYNHIKNNSFYFFFTLRNCRVLTKNKME